MKILIIGNGPAGFSAARKIKALKPDFEVSILCRENLPLYAKIRLPEFIAGKVPENKLFLSKLEDYQKFRIGFVSGENATAIDRNGRMLVTESGLRLNYDKLILALGSKPFIPPVNGICIEGIFVLRTLDDAKSIAEAAKSARKAVVIGGGLLGLELAYALKDLGLKVDVIEYFPRLLPKNIDEKCSRILLEKLKDTGVGFFLGRNVSEVLKADGGLLFKTDKADAISCDFAVFSAGIRSETALASKAELSVKKGIVVNERLETSERNIYAVGDCAEVNGTVEGLWVAAKEQGEAAAAIICGTMAKYVPSKFEPSLKVSNINLKDIKNYAESVKP